MAIVKPNFPGTLIDENPYYPYLASVEIDAAALREACVKEVEVIGICSANTVSVVLDGFEYHDIPVYIHTDVGCRAQALASEEALAVENYFDVSATLFPIAGGVTTSLGVTVAPRALALTDKDGVPLFIFHVISSCFYEFEGNKLAAPPTWRLYALIRIANPSSTIGEYSLYDMVADDVADVPTYVSGDPSTPIITADRVSLDDADDTVVPFVGTGFAFPNTRSFTAWRPIGCRIPYNAPHTYLPPFTAGAAIEHDTPFALYVTDAVNGDVYPFSGDLTYVGSERTAWAECGLSPVTARCDYHRWYVGADINQELSYNYPIFSTATSSESYTSDPFSSSVGSSLVVFYDDGTRDYVLYRINHQEEQTPTTLNATTTEALLVIDDPESAYSTDNIASFESFHEVSGSSSHQVSYGDFNVNINRVLVEDCFIWSGAAGVLTVTALRMETVDGTNTDSYESQAGVSVRTESGVLVQDTSGLEIFIREKFDEITADNPGVALRAGVAFYLIPHDVKIGAL